MFFILTVRKIGMYLLFGESNINYFALLFHLCLVFSRSVITEVLMTYLRLVDIKIFSFSVVCFYNLFSVFLDFLWQYFQC